MLTVLFKIIGVIISIPFLNYIYLLLKNKEVVKFAWKINGAYLPVLPVVGTTYVVLLKKSTPNIFGFLDVLNRWSNFPFNAWIGSDYHYATDDSEEAKIILNNPKCFDKSGVYNQINAVFPETILVVEGEKWRPRRKYLRPAFKSSLIESFIPTFYEESWKLVNKSKTLKSEDCMYSFFNKHAAACFLRTSFGENEKLPSSFIDNFGDEIISVIHAIRIVILWLKYVTLKKFDFQHTLMLSLQREFGKLMTKPGVPAKLWMNLPLGSALKKQLIVSKNRVNEFMIRKKKNEELSTEYAHNTTLIDFLQLKNYEKISNADHLEEFYMFTSAAVDTTGHTLAFCCLLLGMNQDIQQKLYDEIRSIASDRDIDSNSIKKMHYLEMVLNETLRILPPIPFIARSCSEEVDLGNKILPKGSCPIISIFHIHRNPKYWTDPRKFDPERFSSENVKKILPGSYLPFSLGPRDCIGKSFAQTLLKVTMASLVRNYQIFTDHESIDELLLESIISMKTEQPLRIKFVSRIEK